jgi:uncharacterized repeat protein (TIGR03833 family)
MTTLLARGKNIVKQPILPNRQYKTMNRNNRQQRPPRQQNGAGNRPPRAPREYKAVPTIQQVTPGAAVSIVLKQDQPTGREVQGTVQDLLTRGNHPRGIKVRLTDGRVGRVQRMASDNPPSQQPTTPSPFTVRREGQGAPTYSDVRNNEFPSEPPPRTLFDFLPDTNTAPAPAPTSEPVIFSSATVKCPICDAFEGDEAAVTHHVESHLA